jgi:chorismate synthase
MPGNSFGQAFRITTFGESHGPAVGVIIDGCPPGLPLGEADIQPDLDRRRPGQSSITTARQEGDEIEILSGTFEGVTTGTPICMMVRNKDARSRDYSNIKDLFRPGHADHTYLAKYGTRDYRGGGRASARETIGRVAAGAVAKKLLAREGADVIAYTCQIGDVVMTPPKGRVTLGAVESNPVRCPDSDAAARMEALIHEVRADQDSIGGAVELAAYGVPVGLGEPVFDKLKADLAKALLSLPAVVGFEYGSGFDAVAMRGSEHNDIYEMQSGEVRTHTNRHGGMLGGISSGEPIVMRVAIKPTSSISKSQDTLNIYGEASEISTTGRHDPCLAPRFIPMGEAMVALVLADHLLRWKAIGGGVDIPHVPHTRDDAEETS